MKAKHLFWGLLFITLGILILVNNFSSLNWDWEGLWKLWPLVFILWGVGIMLKNNAVKVVVAGLAGIVFAVSLYASFKTIVYLTTGDFDIVFDTGSDSAYKYDFTDYTEPYTDSIKTAEFHFKAGAGSFTSISDSAADLFHARSEGVKNNYELTNLVDGDKASLEMTMKKKSIRVGRHSIRNRVEMYFNPQPVWDMNFDVGASSVNLDLSPVKVSSLKIRMGAASFKVKLGGNTARTDVNIETGASDVDLNVPESAGCEIRTDGALNSEKFRGFKKINSDLYRTSNFDSSANKIYIRIDSGVSSLEVNRYSKIW